jgi:hypothetical protein
MARFLLILSALLSICAGATAQETILGVLEDNPGHYAGDPNFRSVRTVFAKNGNEWHPLADDCPDQKCLISVTARYPRELTWTVSFDGSDLGQVTSRTPDDFRWYSSIGQGEIVSDGLVPTVGKRSVEFSGYIGAPLYRPLITNTKPYYKDPDAWRPFNPSQDLTTRLRQEFRKHYPKLCRTSEADESKLESFAYRDEDVEVIKAYTSKRGLSIARMHLQAIECNDIEAGFDIEDPWFVVDVRGSVRYLDAGMWLVDAGDYDNDGQSEVLFSLASDNVGGYELFYDEFTKRVRFQFNYH